MDLDDFKYVNDTYGHDIGDELLKIVGLRIYEVLRPTDLFRGGRDSCISRLGGDEFSIILVNLPNAEVAGKIAARIIDIFKNPIVIKKYELNVGMSIGIAMFPQSGSSAAELCKHADEAMYEAKKSGKNTYCYYANKI
jgi:diguanylate cyclase (GGDEF)-like protein